MVNLVIDLVVLLLLSWFASLQQACNRSDQESLLSLNFITSSSPLNWSSSIECCLWEGIKCDDNGRVTHLLLPWRGLSGTIAPSIGNLTHLSHLNLSHNNLLGPLRNYIFSSVIHLETLDLGHNHLSGEFPTLSSNYIKIIDLSTNLFNGMIPSSLFSPSKSLISFNISNNSFSGFIPSFSWIDSVCSVSFLDFSYNDFSGHFPPGLGNCSKLQTFRAGFNNLSGSLPDEIYFATSLEEISMHSNYLSGPINNGIVYLTNLTILELYSNQFSGYIPKDIGKLTKLKILLLQDNRLSGSLPPSMKNCTNLIRLKLGNNTFDGEISAFNFSTFPQLRTLDLGYNNFTGSLPLNFNSCKLLSAIRLSGNNLEVQISPDIVALESLSYLSLSRNYITNITDAIRILMGCKNLRVLILSRNFMDEAMPDDEQITFSNGFQNLQVLALGGCQLRGQVPTWIGKLRQLQVLDLSVNQITGPIPSWLGNLTSLYYIDLSHNFISGKFPKELSRLPMLTSEEANDQVDKIHLDLPVIVIPTNALNMEYYKLLYLPPAIYLKNNSLSGSIPNEIGQLKFLHVLDLSQNNFSGNIPDQLSQLTNLERLDLSGNQLSGEIPASLSSLNFLSIFSVADNNLQGPIPSGGQFHTFPSSSFEGNPGLCGYVSRSSCTIQPRTASLPVPRESSNKELGYGLIAGVVFGFIIGSTIGTLYPVRRSKALQHIRTV